VQCQRKDWKRHRLFCNMSPIKTALDETSNPLTQFHTTRPEVFKKMMTLIKEDPANIYLVLLNGDITAVTNKEVLERAGLEKAWQMFQTRNEGQTVIALEDTNRVFYMARVRFGTAYFVE
jgi:hypothetical protein